MTAMVEETAGRLRYQQRVVAFVDILGFGSLVKRADQDAALRSKLYSVLHSVRDFTAPTKRDTDFRAQNFSDSLIISAANTADGLLADPCLVYPPRSFVAFLLSEILLSSNARAAEGSRY